MAKRILVPLGEHDRAEAIVPVVAALAREGGGTVRLLHVEPPQRTRFDESARRLLDYAHVAEERLEAEGLARLGRLDPLLDGVAVERAVRFGDVVDEIAREADAFEADLIAVTERRRPWWRPALAPIVERLRSRVRVPVLALSGAAR